MFIARVRDVEGGGEGRSTAVRQVALILAKEPVDPTPRAGAEPRHGMAGPVHFPCTAP